MSPPLSFEILATLRRKLQSFFFFFSNHSFIYRENPRRYKLSSLSKKNFKIYLKKKNRKIKKIVRRDVFFQSEFG